MISESILEKLEFAKVKQFIAKYAYTESGKEKILSLYPLTYVDKIKSEGELVSAAKDILINNDIPPISYLPDITDELYRSGIEGTALEPKTMLSILNLAETSRKTYSFLKNKGEDNVVAKKFLSGLFIDKVFEHNISRIIDEKGEVKENASPKLTEIRAEIRSKSAALTRTINHILKSLSDQYVVRDEYITQRDGRFVVPIKAEHKRQVKGFIHSESSSGQTVYIEPEETLELNNDLLSLSFAEKREIEKILKELTRYIGEKKEDLLMTLNSIAELDSIFSRAQYSIEIIGSFPSLDGDKAFKLWDARHPLLIKRIGRAKTVPLNLEIEDKNVIIITGPNAGGKTVILKTIGLLSAMVYSGIHIPASPDSNMSVFDSIEIDIGDQQSIEDDLSAFSSHLTNIKGIVERAGSRSLILLDELGRGTDPAEGAALAMAVLTDLKAKGSVVFATTHYGSLKIHAHSMEGFQNASMEFDSENLAPTYKFMQGVPGSSYAFEIARRIGFKDELLGAAKMNIDKDKYKVEEFLADLEAKSRKLELNLKDMEIENSRLHGLTNLYRQNNEKLKEEKNKILKEAKQKADEYLKDVNKRVEKAIKDIRETGAKPETVKNIRHDLNELKKQNELLYKGDVKEGTIQVDLKEGDYAVIKNSNTYGRIEEINRDKNKAVLVSGSIRMKADLSDLLPASRKEAEKNSGRFESGNYDIAPQKYNYRLDIRGKKAADAEFEIIKFLDDSYSQGASRVEILHGKGTGALKKTVKDILSSNENVKTSYYANLEAGGDGITIVEFN